MVRDPLKTTASERQRAVQEAIRKLTALDVPDDGTSNEPSRKVAKPARRVAEKPRRERPKH
jgi:hypothetical protein